MATATVTYQPAAGRSYVELTSWAGDASFTTTPVATDQIEGPNTLTLNADGTVTGADGSYTLNHIQATGGTTEAVEYQIGAVTQVPAGTVTLGTSTVDQSTIALPFTYSDTDQTGFEYRVDGGTWTTTTSPVSLTGLNADTPYVIEVRAVNADGGGTPASTTLTTDPVPSSATTTVPLVMGPSYTVTTLEAGFDPYVFQQWPANEPAAGWQLVTVTAEGYFDSQGNYWFDSGTEAVHDVWVVDLTGTVYAETVDSTGLEQPLTGTITIDPPTVGRTTATISFSYSASDADGYEYRLDGGAWANAVSPISLSGLDPETPYTVDIRTYSATTQSVASSVTFTTNSAVDTTPSAFGFNPVTNAARSVTVTSNAVAVQGVDVGVDVPISVSGDSSSEYSVSTNGSDWGGWTSAATTVRLNYQVRVRHMTSDEYSSGGYDGVRETALTIGGVTGIFTSTTLADGTAPVISLTGGNVTVTQGDTWAEPGYEAIDNADGDISVSGVVITGSVDTSTVGQYQLIYTATDASGNSSSTTRTVTVVEAVPDDTTKPVIQLSGGNQTLSVGDTWSEPGYSAVDEVDGNLTDQVQVSGSVNTALPGSYVLTYTVSDTTGNIASATRTVTVVADLDLTIPAPSYRTITPEFVAFGGAAAEVLFKSPRELLDYDIALDGWLTDEADTIDSGMANLVVETGNADLLVQASGYIDASNRIKLWLSGGRDGGTYTVSVFITTALRRRKKFIFRLATRAFW